MIIAIPDGASLDDALALVRQAFVAQSGHGSTLARYEGDSIVLTKTGHRIGKPVSGELIMGYYSRVAHLIGGRSDAAGALAMGGATPYNIGNTGDAGLDLATQVDAFANPDAYGLGNGPATPSLDAQQQSTLQPGQVDVRAIQRDQLEGLLVAIGRNEVGLALKYGPTALMHELSTLMSTGGIHEDPARPGFIVPPPSFPWLSDMTVERAKQLAGLA